MFHFVNALSFSIAQAGPGLAEYSIYNVMPKRVKSTEVVPAIELPVIEELLLDEREPVSSGSSNLKRAQQLYQQRRGVSSGSSQSRSQVEYNEPQRPRKTQGSSGGFQQRLLKNIGARPPTSSGTVILHGMRGGGMMNY